MKRLRSNAFCWLAALAMATVAWGGTPEVLRPRVPSEQLETVRAVRNPLTSTPETIAKGKALYHGKAFCLVCHGADGRGLGSDLDLKGPLPRDFTDKEWQQARTDGELIWILKNGSAGTAMAPFIPLVLTEEEAWQLISYIRDLGK
jgi:mono/diheme cytochrome c family protein